MEEINKFFKESQDYINKQFKKIYKTIRDLKIEIETIKKEGKKTQIEGILEMKKKFRNSRKKLKRKAYPIESKDGRENVRN